MNARTTMLMIVLALVLAACVAPMPAPPPRVQPPNIEQTLPIQNEPARNTLPASPSTRLEAVATDLQAKALLAAQQQLVSRLMAGLPLLTRPYIETYAANKVANEGAPVELNVLTTAQKFALINHYAVGAPPEVRPAIERYIDALTNADKIERIERLSVGVPPEVHSAIRQYVETLQTP